MQSGTGSGKFGQKRFQNSITGEKITNGKLAILASLQSWSNLDILGAGWQNPECADNQNYNKENMEFRIVVSKKEAYHQFGNSVAVPVIKRLAKEIVSQLLNNKV